MEPKKKGGGINLAHSIQKKMYLQIKGGDGKSKI